MKQLSSSDVRQMFLDFFKEKGHSIEPSAPLVPNNDPTLLWINSGVATMKKYFDGSVIPENPRMANAQKSIRTNDIENVGKTARHHTFFEMLGNFSIGDYFKEGAIEWAWEFLTSPKWIGFDPDKLYVTVYPEDEEAKQIWREKVGLSEEHIVEIEDNFWDIGVGPSGPDSEIFYDRGPAFGDDANDPELYPGGENERYLEIWNLVFSQFNHNPDGTYTPLPKQNIDTGMGLERMVSIIQDAPTNFETDLFMPIIRETEQVSGEKYGVSAEKDVAFKVIADHIRTVAFAIGDGALPSNEGRGYVLRRLLRRAVRYAKILGIDEPFMYKLVPVVGKIMNSFYPEVEKQTDFIQKVIRNEEERFHETLNEGLAILEEILKDAKASGVVQGKDIFKLYDTYGFPVELTEEYALDHALEVDHAGFEAEMEKQRDRARKARADVKSMNVQGDLLGDLTEPSVFVGYETMHAASEILYLIQNDQLVEEVRAGEEAQAIFKETPFYAESGGQVADHGTVQSETGLAFVEDVQKAPNKQNLHRIKVTEGVLKLSDTVKLTVDRTKRLSTVKNHTATHLLHRALKDTLGEHVNQAGSLVAPDRLRFDFSHFGQITKEELAQMEEIVNQKIWAELAVDINEMPIDEAKALGAMALFGEKYGDIVRVVKVGDYSIELCGGVHVKNTAEIGLFKIQSEGGIGAGTRRIEALTGEAAYRFMNEQQALLQETGDLLKVKQTKETPAKVESLQQELKELKRENESLEAKLASAASEDIFKDPETVNGLPVIAKKITAKDMNQLRKFADTWKAKQIGGILVLGAPQGEKVNLLAAVSDEAQAQGYHAGKIVKEVAMRCGGNGGGKPDMAQAGGKNPAELGSALKAVPEIIQTLS
ncbi:alanine--tRNA ligase [Listeria costaricensis]|uniref:alanine--tRNA ligase n=1 Tax=Listeria costaricensis TaxID=2026604 RepID=UPI000C068382|nr:alanine--tRNA ligase [Listeria costaricensis]